MRALDLGFGDAAPSPAKPEGSRGSSIPHCHHEGLSPGFCWLAAPQMPTCHRVHTWPGEGRCLPGGTSAGGLSSPWWESEKGYGVHLCEGRGARCNDDAAVITQKEEEKNRIKSEP